MYRPLTGADPEMAEPSVLTGTIPSKGAGEYLLSADSIGFSAS
ncbi:MAG: hypothetical protein ABW145_16880 [Candidatus Thiodiazotropha sp.]